MKSRDAGELSNWRLLAVISLVSTFAVYLLTLAPTVQSFDSAELTVGARALGFVHAPGYPLYMLLGNGFSWLPFGDVGLRLNLMSAVFASLTVLVLFWILRWDLDTPFLAFSALLLSATIPLFWSQALRAEVYTLQVFLMVAVLYLWRRAHETDQPGWYVLCYVFLGLGLANHTTTVLLWGTLLLLLVWEARHFRLLAVTGTGLGLAITAILYLYFPLRSAADPAIDYINTYFHVDLSSFAGVWWLFSAEMFQHALYAGPGLAHIANEFYQFGIFLWESFLGIGLILGIWGWWRLRTRHRLWNRLLSAYFLLNVLFYVLYHVVDKEVMFMPVFAVWCIWVAVGVGELAKWMAVQIPDLPARTATTIAGGVLLLIAGVGLVLNWPSVSLRTNQKVYSFAAQLLEDVEPSAVVVNGWVTASVLDYLQLVEGRRPDVQSFNLDFYNLGLQERHGSLTSASAQAEWYSWLEDQLQQRPLCFLEPLPAVPEHYRWTRQGLCWGLSR